MCKARAIYIYMYIGIQVAAVYIGTTTVRARFIPLRGGHVSCIAHSVAGFETNTNSDHTYSCGRI